MKKIAFFIVLIIAWYGCKKDDKEISKFAPGTYFGEKTIYYSSTHYESIDTITINFDSTTYTYSSSDALDFGKGNYFIKNDSIGFNDLEIRTALYTWDWILSGMYKFVIIDDSMILDSKYYNVQISCRLKKTK
jgi:hypothetical protein